ncbi:PepSY-associated TM helix domain-containing protein [Gammaproteobacteria bacterium]|nr:PepSY-associated TM helix domain-containing protein [Gammaproteobacteria bacterium]
MAINRQLLNWSRIIHVYFSIALMLVLIFFSITGITLNNAEILTGNPEVTTLTLNELPDLPRNDDNRITASPELERFVKAEFGIRLKHAEVSYEDEFLVIDYQAPGKATLVEIDQEFGEAFVESTNFGLIAVLNDLHKGRDVDIIFSWLIDISGILLVLFSLAGFILLLPNKRRFRKVSLYSVVGIIILTASYLLSS